MKNNKTIKQDNPVPILTQSDWLNIQAALEQASENPGLSGNVYSDLLKKLEGVETTKEQPKKELNKEFEGLELAFSFAIAQCLDEESDEHEEMFGRKLNFWKNGKYNEDKTSKHPHQWWAKPEDIKELNKLLRLKR